MVYYLNPLGDRAMAFAFPSAQRQPLSEINMTPLVDVLLVLLVMLILTVPIASHSLEYDLPQQGGKANPVKNSLAVTIDGRALWNGTSVTDRELAASLGLVREMTPEPEVQFRPDPNASYARTSEVLQIVKASQITRFGFVDNEKYRTFSR
jgi:biopolymer transport protein ExbD